MPPSGRSRPSRPAPSTPLAHQHKISPATEHSIHTAFTLFASPSPTDPLLPSTSLSPALRALGLRISKRDLNDLLDAADPDASGYISYETFVAVAALKLESRDDDDNDGGAEQEKEVDEVFRLFVGEGGAGKGAGKEVSGEEEVITLQMLKRVAKVLKEDVDEKILRDMILEANGGAGVRRGVGRGQFGEVMRRAGCLK
ncbi:MAG: hypothetical protein Q9182_004383 [Xanthomendoza sp. 2 TL-2023]